MWGTLRPTAPSTTTVYDPASGAVSFRPHPPSAVRGGVSTWGDHAERKSFDSTVCGESDCQADAQGALSCERRGLDALHISPRPTLRVGNSSRYAQALGYGEALGFESCLDNTSKPPRLCATARQWRVSWGVNNRIDFAAAAGTKHVQRNADGCLALLATERDHLSTAAQWTAPRGLTVDSTAAQQHARKRLELEERYERDLVVHQHLVGSPLFFFEEMPGGGLGEQMRTRAVAILQPGNQVSDKLHNACCTAEGATEHLLTHRAVARLASPPHPAEEVDAPSEVPPEYDAQTQLQINLEAAAMEKEKMWCFAQRLNTVIRALLSLIEDEKEKRLSLLSGFCSCRYPKVCACLQRDWDIAELSRVELERRASPRCVFVSAVLSHREKFEADLLREREVELRQLLLRVELERSALESKEENVEMEKRAFDLLIGYHLMCMKVVGVRVVLGSRDERVEPVEVVDAEDCASVSESVVSPPQMVVYSSHHVDERNLVSKVRQSFSAFYLAWQNSSPLLSFRTYLWLLDLQCEEVTRRSIATSIVREDELVQILSLQEQEQREWIAALEMQSRVIVVVDMEQLERQLIDFSTRIIFRYHVIPKHQRSLAALHRSIMDEEDRVQRLCYATSGLEVLVEYERQRRWTLALLELQVRSDIRMAFYSISTASSAQAMQKLLGKRQLDEVVKSEQVVRRSLVEMEEVAYMVAVQAKRLCATQMSTDRYGIATAEELEWRFLVEIAHEEAKGRDALLQLWQNQWTVLFGTPFCRPSKALQQEIADDLYAFGCQTLTVPWDMANIPRVTWDSRSCHEPEDLPRPRIAVIEAHARDVAQRAALSVSHPFAREEVDLRFGIIGDLGELCDAEFIIRFLE